MVGTILIERFDSIYGVSLGQSFKDTSFCYKRGIAVSPLKMVMVSITWWNVGMTEFQNQFSVLEILVRYLQ